MDRCWDGPVANGVEIRIIYFDVYLFSTNHFFPFVLTSPPCIKFSYHNLISEKTMLTALLTLGKESQLCAHSPTTTHQHDALII
jgi:hypothetical protein